MQSDDVILTVSSFAGGRDAAIGLISLSARYACVYWVASGHVEPRQIASTAWARVEFEAGVGQVPRRLHPTSALATALFADRRTAMSTEYISRFPLARPEDVPLTDALDEFLAQTAIEIKLDLPLDSLESPLDAILAQTI